MADWTLLLAASPLNQEPGTNGLISPLSLASGISVTMKNDDIDALSFTVPGRHYQTALIETGVTDVLVYRNDAVIQRFRVTARAFSSSNGNLTCQVTGSSYRELLNATVFADEGSNLNHLSWEADTEQTAIAYTIIQDAQAKSSGTLGITRGVVPANLLNVTAFVEDLSTTVEPQWFFAVGSSRGQGIQRLANGESTPVTVPPEGVLPGFDWSIDPDPNAPLTGLVFNAWNKEARRTSSELVTDFLLSEATMATWSMVEDMGAYANVVRVHGVRAEVDGVLLAMPEDAWVPADHNPIDHPERGRWEFDLGTELDTTEKVAARAENEYRAHTLFADAWTVTLTPGRWEGPDSFWLGDNLRVMLQVDAVNDEGNATGVSVLEFPPADDLTKTLRVQEISVSVDSSGAESVTVGLNRPPFSLLDQIAAVQTQVTEVARR